MIQVSNRRDAERPPSLGMGFIEELAVRMDRLERQFMSGGSSDARIPARALIPDPASKVRGMSVKRGGSRTRIFGQISARVLSNLFDEAKEFLNTNSRRHGIDETIATFRKLHESLRQEHRDSLVTMTVYVDSVMPIWKRMTDILPSKPVCDRLVAAYMDITESITRIVHFPTFREQYNLFWDGKLQSDYFLPQLLSMLAIVSRFTTKSQGFGHERVDGVHTPTAFALVRTWLDGLAGKHLIDLVVIQIEMLLIVCRRALMFRPQELWVPLGRVIRMAMTMGLHRDPSELGSRITPFVGEMRRRLWYAICELDTQTSFDSDMPCSIRDEEYTCSPPRNLNDEDIYPDMKELPVGKPIEEHTSMQHAVLGSISLPTRARISRVLARIDTVQDYREVMELGEKLDDILEDMDRILPRHNIMDHSRMSRVWRERVSSDAHVRQPLLALYRPFALSAPTCPPQITKSFLRSCMVVLGYSDEPDPRDPHHREILGILYQVFRNDLLPAALGVCYFIQTFNKAQVNGSYDGQRQSPNTPGRSPSLVGEGHFLWSPERLLRAVRRTLDYFVQSIVRNTGTKDIVTLAVVLEMVRSAEPKTEEIGQALRTTLDACLEAAKTSREKLAMVSMSHTGSSAPPGFTPDPYLGGQAGGFGYADGGYGSRHPDDGLERTWTLWGGWE
ncbi:fungal specific transcription factor domain-containing protein [Sarocladium implicatum]|nr:fungal specific transcription factor domain-containing protein [Sarocladium implicatum]